MHPLYCSNSAGGEGWLATPWISHCCCCLVHQFLPPLFSPDPSLTAENVSSVLETVEETTMFFLLNVPNSRRFFFGGRDSIEPERRQACVDWWLQCSPNASWTWLAGQLYLEEQKTALETVQLQYIQKETAGTIILWVPTSIVLCQGLAQTLAPPP